MSRSYAAPYKLAKEAPVHRVCKLCFAPVAMEIRDPTAMRYPRAPLPAKRARYGLSPAGIPSRRLQLASVLPVSTGR